VRARGRIPRSLYHRDLIDLAQTETGCSGTEYARGADLSLEPEFKGDVLCRIAVVVHLDGVDHVRIEWKVIWTIALLKRIDTHEERDFRGVAGAYGVCDIRVEFKPLYALPSSLQSVR